MREEGVLVLQRTECEAKIAPGNYLERASCAEPSLSASGRVFLVVIDESLEHRAALRFAARRALHTGGTVALLAVATIPEYLHWPFFGSLLEREALSHAEERLHRAAAECYALTGKMSELFLWQGNPRDALFGVVAEDERISVVVLASAPTSMGGRGPGPLVSALTGKLAGKLKIPVTIIPGDLADDEIDALS